MEKEKGFVDIKRLILINQIILLVGGGLYGLVYIFGGSIAAGIGVFASAILAPSLAQYAKKKISINVTVYILTTAQTLLIVLFGCVSGDLAATYSLIAACLAMNCLYYNKKILVIHWIAVNVVILGGFIFPDLYYAGREIDFLLRGILGLNFCILFLYFLVSWGSASMEKARRKTDEAHDLVLKVQSQMDESEQSADKQTKVFNEIRMRSDNLSGTTGKMLHISSDLKESSAHQTSIIDSLSSQSDDITEGMKNVQAQAEESSSLAVECSDKLEENDNNMKLVVEAIHKIEKSSNRIIGIIKNIENIAFQTNILALNASVEAARAGEAGKGFAVVAQEVRTLATRSSKAAADSAKMVNESIESVKQGAALIDVAAKNMSEAIDYSKSSAKGASAITQMVLDQVEVIEGVFEQMKEISEITAQTSATAVESSEIADELAREIDFIYTAMK